MPNSQQHSLKTRIHRLVQKINPPSRPSYGPNHINKANISSPPILSRILTRYFPQPVPTDVPWYDSSIGNKLDQSLEFFEESTGLQRKELKEVLYWVRNRAWATDQYPCFGLWWFLLPGIEGVKWWDDVVVKGLKEGNVVVDMGCGLGQNIRRLATITDVKTHQLYCLDVSQSLWDLGLELFSDTTTPPATFIQADARTHWTVFTPHDPLFHLTSKVSIILMSHFFDLFHCPDAVAVGKTAAFLSKPGTCVIGYGRGTKRGNAREDWWPEVGTRCMVHDEWSMKMIWHEVGKATETKWEVEVEERGISELGLKKEDVWWMWEPEVVVLCWIARRIA